MLSTPKLFKYRPLGLYCTLRSSSHLLPFPSHLHILSQDGNKKITKWEWLGGMLVRLRYVNPREVAKVIAHFDKANIDGDEELDIDDLKPSKARKNKILKQKMSLQPGTGEERLELEDQQKQRTRNKLFLNVKTTVPLFSTLDSADQSKVKEMLNEVFDFVDRKAQPTLDDANSSEA